MNAPGAREARLLRNTGYLLAAFLLQKPLSFLYFNYLAGSLGVQRLGLYTALHDLIPITLIVIDFSLSVVLTREIAKHPERAQALLSNVVGAKLAFALLTFAVGAALLAFNVIPEEYLPRDAHGLLFLVALVVALDTFTLTFFAAFRGLQNMRYESIGVLATQLVTVTTGFVLLKLGFGLTAAFQAIVLGSVFNLLFSGTLLWRRAHLHPIPSWEWGTLRPLLGAAVPFAATAVLVKLFIYADRYILLGAEGGAKFPLGVYVTAHKWAYTFEFLPSALAAALLPAMSAAFVHSRERLVFLLERSLHYLLTAAAPITVGLFVLGDRILDAFLPPEFQQSVLPLQVLVFAIPAIFLNYPVGTLLNATNRQKFNTLSMALALAVSVTLNLVLVGRYSYVGTAVATLVASTVLVAVGFVWIARFLTVPWRRLLWNAARATVAASAMGLLLAGLKPLLPLPALIAVGLASYIGALIAVGGVSREDGRAVLAAVRGRGFDGA